jgi:alkylation response protein AidB-like acyl-CoA dehydrogenase
MVSQAVLRWGTSWQREYWLPKLARGQVIAAFALSELNVGSDARHVESSATPSGDSYVLKGKKKWITFGQMADLFLIFAQCEGKPSAFLVERGSPGLSVKPINGMLGVRASMLAELQSDDCRVSKQSLIGRVGFGFSHVAATALDHGRYSVAWGCVGIGQACLEACMQYASARKQFGSLLKDHQLIRRMISDMITNLRAARLLCMQAGYLKQAGDPNALVETMIAKYFASRMATKAASDAVQIHGANGCSSEYPVARYFRDAKIMEIIEGSNEIQQIMIAEYAYCGS